MGRILGRRAEQADVEVLHQRPERACTRARERPVDEDGEAVDGVGDVPLDGDAEAGAHHVADEA
jgi:hypothetical protein